MSECECEEFESVSSIVCEYCGHPPVKHEKHRDILSPLAKKRVVSVSNDITQPLANSTQVTFDPATTDPDVSQDSGFLEQGCNSSQAVSDSLVPAGLSEEFPDSSYSPSDPVVPTTDSTAAVSNSLTIESVNPQTSSKYPLAAKNVISFLKKVAREEGDLSSPVLRYHLSITEEEKLKVTCKVCKKISWLAT